MKEIVISDELRDFFEKENEPLKELANEYNAMINNAKDKEIERLKELLVKIYGLTFDIDSNIMKQKYALANGFNFEIKDMTREFYFEREDKLQELKGSDKE